jgi:mRNA interferase RelE/StbE
MARVTSTEARRVAVNVNLTVGLLDQIDHLADSAGVSRSALIRQAVERMLEDADDVAVSEARLRDANDPLVPWKRLKGSAQKEFARLAKSAKSQIADRLDALTADPRPVGAEALAGRLRGLMRLRVGDYRIVYQVDDENRQVTVTRVRHRGKAYR